MGIIGWIIFGLIVGAVAKLLMPGRVDRDHPLGHCGGAGRGLSGPCRGLVWAQ
jgi:uncharacterized membrane protein YeaQ/YmgE (transglycosylase-associated protein family)